MPPATRIAAWLAILMISTLLLLFAAMGLVFGGAFVWGFSTCFVGAHCY